MLSLPVLPPPRHLPTLLALLVLATAHPGRGATGSDPLDAYHAAVAMDFPRAAAAARRANDGRKSPPEARFSLALVLLNEQPQSAAKLDEARRILTTLANDAALPAELRAASLYYCGRLEQSHARPANAGAASQLYARILGEFPRTDYAERAFVMQAVIRQYEPVPVAAKRTLLLELDAQAETHLHTPLTRRLYHLAAGLAWSRLLQDDGQAYAHYLRVYELKLENDYENSNLLVRLAELSRRRGDSATALRFFHEFTTRFPADRRTSLAREWITVLEGKP